MIGFKNWKVKAIYLAIYDLFSVNFAYFLALWLRFDCMYSSIPANYLYAWKAFVPVYSIITISVFWFLSLYKSIWKFASYTELSRVMIASVIINVVHVIGMTCLIQRMPVSYYIFGTIIQFFMTLGVRFFYRFIVLERNLRSKREKDLTATRAMLIGAGNAGQMILRSLLNSDRDNIKVCCIIDDDPNKWDRYLDGIPIVGGRNVIMSSVEKYRIERIFIAIPSADEENKKEILNICKETGCVLKNLPAMYYLIDDQVTVSDMQDVDVEDLLGRKPIRVNMDEIFQDIKGKCILVTGGGGSIGSELCRQIAGHAPKQLVIFDIYENNAHEIQMELQDNYPELNLEVLIGSVRDSRKINQVFAKYRPDIVYHAAAHKHVPLMEYSPCEAIKNNAIGTYKTAYAAMTNGCKKFVLISTDKAVNPTNIMGASKRLCEMIIQTFAQMVREGRTDELPILRAHAEDELSDMVAAPKVQEKPCTEFVAVRFGNVLGSNGSVIPRFKQQIEKGGPVTVTHPDIIRYFMTIPEAVSLVLQAGAYAKGGEIFVLDMGTPVKIDTLARNLIKLSGLKPDVDIEIKYIGLRPGEKLYEEKLMEEEGMRTTPNHLIHIGRPIDIDTEKFLSQLHELMIEAYKDNDRMCELVAEVVPTYHPSGTGGCTVKDKTYEALVESMQESAINEAAAGAEDEQENK